MMCRCVGSVHLWFFASRNVNSIWGNEMSLREVDGAQSNATLNCRLRSCQHSCALHDRSFLFSFAFRRTTLDRPQGSSSLFLLLRAAFRVRASWILIWLDWLVCRRLFRVFWALSNGKGEADIGLNDSEWERSRSCASAGDWVLIVDLPCHEDTILAKLGYCENPSLCYAYDALISCSSSIA